jgi:hypothetical protein
MGWVKELCTNTDGDCVGTEHLFPEEGTRVVVKETVDTRVPGTDDTFHTVPAGSEGIVAGYVVEWHDVDVAMGVLDGEHVWIDCDNLEVKT